MDSRADRYQKLIDNGCKVQFKPRQKRRRDDLNRGRLPLFRQGGATVSLRTRMSMRGIREASYLKGIFVEAIREMLVRRDILGNL